MADRIFEQIISESPTLQEFVETKNIESGHQRIESRWRSNNDVYLLRAGDTQYVLKRVNQTTWEEDIDHQIKLWAAYPNFPPRVFIVDRGSFVMEYVPGTELIVTLQSPYSATQSIMQNAGGNLREIYRQQERYWGRGSALSQVPYTFKYKQFNPHSEEDTFERILPQWESSLAIYPSQIIHNDLNSGNAKVNANGDIRAIDPRADYFGIGDVAKDIGRLLAAVTCATHDNGYSPDETFKTTQAILEPWQDRSDNLPERIAFYAGQSYLSFSRWDTKTITKEELFLVGTHILSKNPSVYCDLEALNQVISQGLSTRTHRKNTV